MKPLMTSSAATFGVKLKLNLNSNQGPEDFDTLRLLLCFATFANAPLCCSLLGGSGGSLPNCSSPADRFIQSWLTARAIQTYLNNLTMGFVTVLHHSPWEESPYLARIIFTGKLKKKRKLRFFLLKFWSKSTLHLAFLLCLRDWPIWVFQRPIPIISS